MQIGAKSPLIGARAPVATRSTPEMNHLAIASILHPRAVRVDLARRRFFEEGQAPTGFIGDLVFESWSRCLRLHGRPNARAAFEPVTYSRTQLALLKSRQLMQAWTDELPRLESILASTSCAAMLTDATGVLIGSSCVGRPHEQLMPIATRLGVNLSEEAVGTTAPGVVARTGKAVSVLGGEHFFESVKQMHCSAAPIRDVNGRLAGVLDISSECVGLGFDAAAVVSLYAAAIENRLLVAQSGEHLVIRLQVTPAMLDSTMTGLVGINTQGRIAWKNGVARSLLGGMDSTAGGLDSHAEQALGLTGPQFDALPESGAASLTLPSGLTVWARIESRPRQDFRHLISCAQAAIPGDGGLSWPRPRSSSAHQFSAALRPEAAPTLPAPRADAAESGQPATGGLRASDLELIRRTLQGCGGNVAAAARRLGVSRGLIYRRLRTGAPPP